MRVPFFDRYVGIDYSGAHTPTSRIRGLQVYVAEPGFEPLAVRPKPPAKNWCRKEIAHLLLEWLLGEERVLVGIDHGFSFPESYFQRYNLKSWPALMEDFSRYWPTDSDHCYVESVRGGGTHGQE